MILLVVCSGCGLIDQPSGVPDPLPSAVFDLLRPDTARDLRLGRGAWYRYLWSPVGPWAIHLVEADLADWCDLGLTVERAGADGPGPARATVSEMTEAADGALAAVNGDFFTPEGLPLGPELSRGSLRSARARPVLGWRPRSTPWIGVPAVGAGSLTVPGWDTEPVDGLSSIVAGYPELLDGGLRVGDLLVDENAGFAAARHPRTAVGFDSSNDRLWVLVVDGRQPAHSVGMTLPELAGLLEGLGVDEALNLDGGGSSVMVIAGRAVSRPSDEAGERAVANALVLTRDRRFCGRRSPGP